MKKDLFVFCIIRYWDENPRVVNNNFRNWLRLLIVTESCNKPQSNRIELEIGNRGSSALCPATNTKHTRQAEMKMRRYLQTGDRLESSVKCKFGLAD